MADELMEAPQEELEAEEARALERRRAALAHVRQLGDPVLRTPALEVAVIDAELRERIDWMRSIMEDAEGVGLAATQVGMLARVLVYRVEPASPVAALVNPRIEWQGQETETAEEGCLSIPGIRVDVERTLHVRVGALDEHGAARTIEASGWEARVLQHEIDHLDGRLMLDRASRSQRREAMRAWRERQLD